MKVGIIMGSVRAKRVCPEIAAYVKRTIENSEELIDQKLKIQVVDLQQIALPLYEDDDELIPAQIKSVDEYADSKTRSWSRIVNALDIIVFVTPQYNWGYPAALKNAIDRLYHEWHGKPALVVSYGGHGGSKCNDQLQEVLYGLKMNVIGGVAVKIPVGTIPLPEDIVPQLSVHNEEILQLLASCIETTRNK
ncbi:AVN_HP_G0090190.mRNA.1.CDS.1 [Saccharomyces cerevisiae]|nr:AVN_HP_G0021460.mRNA.1.CDS.1 [Saccharomyces cerevisiae]CAI4981448.1 AVN_HP_G0027740.mRNA.1.CDS.1 [Saccharomyces cerevisiae]CAI5081409.1 AVN_HP_G0090190.mRNA.1.CDS.1 [Saccharomyces cerevisiae]CAI6752608.1 AVN_HP_G0021460.mRNA.1.CDS.1 [Saccharomyces cerevisiae]CAI6812170.1 AVN_HP_G0027740.mRNA.1.CDS.1 [Saccharomyces cerevisiae]